LIYFQGRQLYLQELILDKIQYCLSLQYFH